MWRTTWQSCPSVSSSAALMTLWSGGVQRRTVSSNTCTTFVLHLPDFPTLSPSVLFPPPSFRDDQTVFTGCGLGGTRLPHCGHSPWDLWWTPVNCPVSQLHPCWWSSHHYNTTGGERQSLPQSFPFVYRSCSQQATHASSFKMKNWQLGGSPLSAKGNFTSHRWLHQSLCTVCTCLVTWKASMLRSLTSSMELHKCQ